MQTCKVRSKRHKRGNKSKYKPPKKKEKVRDKVSNVIIISAPTTEAGLHTSRGRGLNVPVSMDVRGTEGKAVMEQSGVNHGSVLSPLQQITQVT